MNIAFLIITYGDNYLSECINSIRRFYDYPIYIVDNNINGYTFDTYNNLNNKTFYTKNIENSFELGAIWYGCKKFHIVDKFIILHNSMILIDKLPIELENCHFLSFWKALSCDYSPVVKWVKQKLKENNIHLEHDKIWYSITGCCCIIDTIYIKQLISLGYDKLYGTNKTNAVGTEILFGYLISNILNIPNNSLFIHTLDDNVTGKITYKYIKKIASGQGRHNNNSYLNLSDLKIFNKIFSIDLNYTLDLNEHYIKLLNEIDKDENLHIQYFLLNTNNATLICPNNNFSTVIASIRHHMFTKYFFPTYYEKEKQMILSGEKKVF
jgi:hypothetical protein